MRTVRATTMNDVSSRSHAIFQLIFSQTKVSSDGINVCKMERVSKISLVDLAGSERSGQINSQSSSRMKEGNVINQSLSTLGKVMTTLAERSSGKTRGLHIPYRESILTWLLRESLGGNAKTFMVAAISPASDNFEETLSTLRYANQAKKIVNAAVVNEDATATMLRQLNDEIQQLRLQLASIKQDRRDSDDVADDSELTQRLLESEKLVETLNETWEDKLIKTRELQETRMDRLRDHGILLANDDDDDDVPLGVMAPRSIPFLLNLTPKTTQCLVYYIREGTTTVGSGYDDMSEESHSDGDCDVPASEHRLTPSSRGITLQARHILPHHCDFFSACSQNYYELPIPVVLLRPCLGARLLRNGRPVTEETQLVTGDMITIGDITFCFTNPEEARFASSPLSDEEQAVGQGGMPMPTSPTQSLPPSLTVVGTAAPLLHDPLLPRSSSVVDLVAEATAEPATSPSLAEGTASATMTGDETLASPALSCTSLEENFSRRSLGSTSPRLWPTSSPLSQPGLEVDEGPCHSGSGSGQTPDTQRLSPLGAAKDETLKMEDGLLQRQARTAHMQQNAFFEYDLCKEYALLVHFTTQAHHHCFEYALAPAFALYMMLRYRQQVSGADELRAFVDKLALLIKHATTQSRKQRSMWALAIWMANASELLMAVRHDESFVATSGAAQLCLNEVVQEAFAALVSETKARLRPAVPAMLEEHGVFTLKAQGRDNMTAGPEHGLQYVIESLDALCALLHQSQVNNSLIQALFCSVFYYLGAALFNEFIATKDRDMFQWDRGLIIRFNVQLLSDWALSRQLSVDNHFAHIIQASQLLQTNKSSLKHLDAICEACSALNSLQLDQILTKYRPQTDEQKMPAVLADCLRARAMAKVDKATLEDETVNGCVQLLRNAHFLLPFRLSAASFSFAEKLVSRRGL